MSIAVLEPVSIWSSIQSQIKKQEPSIQKQQEPYIDPCLKRNSSSNLSPKSLEICTESLCSETGSDEFFEPDFFSSSSSSSPKTQHSGSRFSLKTRKVITVSPPRRSFPPPISSMSRQMRAHRIEGRLIVQSVSAPEHNCLHAERHNGRLLLTFKNSTASASVSSQEETISTEKAEPEDEEEVEHSSKENHETSSEAVSQFSHVNQASSNITTVASVAATTSSVSATSADEGCCFVSDDKVSLMSKRKNKEELVHDMRRCSELRKPLFVWEPGCIATSF